MNARLCHGTRHDFAQDESHRDLSDGPDLYDIPLSPLQIPWYHGLWA
jgi:hypothetical protein